MTFTDPARRASSPHAAMLIPGHGGNLARSLIDAPSPRAGHLLFLAQEGQQLRAEITDAGRRAFSRPSSARAATDRRSLPSAESPALLFPFPKINHDCHVDGSLGSDASDRSRSAFA